MEIDPQEYAQFLVWKEQQKTLQKNIETIRSVFEAESRAHTEDFFAPFSDDSLFWMNGSSPSSGALQGVPAMKVVFEAFMNALVSGISMTITNAVADGDWVVTETVGRAETKDGLPYNSHYVQLWKFKDSKIVDFREYLDTKLLSDTFKF